MFVHGNSTLRYSMILVQNFTDLVKASDKLEKTGFYTHFKADFYSHTVKRRKEIYNKFFKKN
jgi:FMN phosphatase YigB (HAD superfamily)